MDDALYRLHAEREETYWWWVAKNRIIMSLVDRYAPKGTDRSALDIGCGAGAVLARLAERGYGSVGVDMSPIAREYCAKRGLLALDGSLPDGLPLDHPSFQGGFDVIVASEVIEHVPEDRPSIARLASLLRPGGVLVCTVPAHMWLWSSHDDFNYHKRRYTLDGFASLFPDSLERLVASYYQMASMPLVVGARFAERARIKLTGKTPTEPHVKPLPGAINWLLTKAFESEKHVLPHARVLCGTSVITVHRRRVP